MPEFFGICGRFTPTQCKLAWISTYPNKVGTYPSEFLPSQRTIYHSTADIGFRFRPPILDQGESFGLFLGGLLFGGFAPPQFDIFTSQSHFATIFAKTANRLNVSHIVTQEEINQAASNGGVALIDTGEYVFEFLGVTDQQEDISENLTQEEIDQIQGTNETASDRAFRKLFEQQIPPERNRYLGIELNKRGITYRFDNGSAKVNSALKLAGIGDLQNASYRDGSSRVIRVDFSKITSRVPLPAGSPKPPVGSLQETPREVRAGDIIYLTYVAVKEHYIRQSVEAGYTVQAISIPPQAFGFPSRILVANYRFYEWFVRNDDPRGLPVKIGGWRIVESFNIPSNIVAPVGNTGESAEIGQFPMTGGRDVVEIDILNTNDISIGELNSYINNPSESIVADKTHINLNKYIFNANYHQQINQSFKRSDWYLRRNYITYNSHIDITKHVLYNVHPKALLKRDVDKWGIERFLAEEIEKDIKEGKDTFFPFMDDEKVLHPTNGTPQFLNSSNTKFEPIQPLSRYSLANLEVDAGVAGSVQLGQTGSTDDVVAAVNFTSNIITERFEEDTRVLVERHFTLGQRGHRFVGIEGLAGTRKSLSCIVDPTGSYAFAVHVNDDSLLIINRFDINEINEDIENLTYRPDLGTPPQKDNISPSPSQFEKRLGYGGLLGHQGVSPGRILSYYKYSEFSLFIYKTTNRESVVTVFPEIKPENISDITFVAEENKITILVGPGYSGRTEINYTCSNENGIRAMMLFKSGNNINGIVDFVDFDFTTKPINMTISHYWTKGDVIEFYGDNLSDVSINDITVQQISVNHGGDFLDGSPDSSAQDKFSDKLISNNIFFQTDTMSIGEDEKSRLYIFFNDSHGGISCIQSNDFGTSWYFHYQVILPVQTESVKNPFVINVFDERGCYLFFQFLGKILCKFIPFQLFLFEDALLIQSDSENRNNLYSQSGNTLRRSIYASAAAGDLTDLVFRQLTGRDPNNQNILNNTEVVTISNVDGTVSEETVIKNPLSIGAGTAFTNKNIEDIHFSAYRNNKGVLKLFFLLPAKDSIGGGNQLQCHFSTNGGISWYDYWEWIEYDYNRIRNDEQNKTQFIDRNAGFQPPGTITSVDPLQSDESAYFGINVHWSRLLRHKKENTTDLDSEVLAIDSPYVYYQKSSKNVFLFYIYKSCLLCKIFSDEIFSEAASKRQTDDGGMRFVKNSIERETKSYFVDGDLSVQDTREEIHRYYNSDTNEIMADGNIVFHSQWGIDTFNSNHRIQPQRVCAHELPKGQVRVIYKRNGSMNLSAAIWTGGYWMVEDLMRNLNEELPILEPPTEATNVCGGFGGNNYPCEETNVL